MSDSNTALTVVLVVLWIIGIIIGILAASKSPSKIFGADGGRIVHLIIALLFAPLELVIGSYELYLQRK